MKSFKNFLNEAANAIIKLGDSGWATRLKGKGGYTDSSGEWYFKTGRELFKKSKGRDVSKKDYDKLQQKYKDEYFNSPQINPPILDPLKKIKA